MPSKNEELLQVKNNCLSTVESLLMELLGTRQDFARFQKEYQSNLPSTIKSLINNCLNLYQLRKETGDIILAIMKREKLIKNIDLLDKNEIIKVYQLSKDIRIWINK